MLKAGCPGMVGTARLSGGAHVQTVSAYALPPVAAEGWCRQARGRVCPRPGQRAGASSKLLLADLLPWESCSPTTQGCPGCSFFLYKVAFTKCRCTWILHMSTKASILLRRVLALAKGRRKRCRRPGEKFYAVCAQVVFLKQEWYFRCSVACVLIIHVISLLNRTDEVLQLPRGLDGCQAQVNPSHLHQMQHRK